MTDSLWFTYLIAGIGIPMIPLSGLINSWYNKSKKKVKHEEYEEVEWSNEKDGATMPKGFKYKKKVEKIQHPPIAKILLSLGIIKVKKK